ncbi:hypothetical protein [Streptomyces sp. B3I8]|uniref:hypothetical protein n=1 Tax=Streptomyces sp. B3I8 TaxID=3042303 RepID=UPI00277E007C|nr:hypothetical protein [Streptomyces sp. B3I8]MDQ0786742.1 hypothetical protein [Streptomyces sp. B3I8]
MAEVTPSDEDRDVREAREARAAHEAAGDPDAGPAAAPIHRTEATGTATGTHTGAGTPARTSTGTGTAASTGTTEPPVGPAAGDGKGGAGSAHGPVSGTALIGGRAGSATDDALTGGAGAHHATHDHGGEPHAARTPLLAHGDTEKFSAQLHHAVGGFVDAPRAAVEEADHVLEQVADLFTDALNRRRRDLRAAWQAGDGNDSDTERLRVALREYREFAERLLHV